MAMTYPTLVVTETGTTITKNATSLTGDKAQTGTGLSLVVENGSGVSVTVTLITPGTVDGLAIADRDVIVPAGAFRAIALADKYRDPSDGLAHITYSAVTTVTAYVLQNR